ncbi:hypothetical protein KIPE111705_46590 [Kibdelosporangium persicum]
MARHRRYGNRRTVPGKLSIQMLRQRQRCRIIEHERRRQTHPGHSGEPVTQLNRHQRVKTQLLERSSGCNAFHAVVAQHGRHTRLHEQQQLAVTLRAGHPRQPTTKPTIVGRTHDAANTRTHQTPQHHRHHAGDGRSIELDRNEGGLVTSESGIEQPQRFYCGQWTDTRPCHPGTIDLGQMCCHAAGLLPQPPRKRSRGQPQRTTMLRQGVQKRVSGRITSLTSTTQHARRRREQHERRQAQTSRYLMQVHGDVHLGRERPVHLIGGQCRDDRVIENTSRVHHRGKIRNPGNQRRQRIPISSVTGHHPNLGTQPRQVTRITTTSADQNHGTNTTLRDQMPGHCTTQRAGAAHDQDRPIDLKNVNAGDRGGDADQSRCQDRPGTNGQLRFTGSHRVGQCPVRFVATVHIDHEEPVGMLRLRRAHQAPDRRGRQLRHVVVGVDRLGRPGEEHQSHRRKLWFSQPRLKEHQCSVHGGTRGLRKRSFRSEARRHDHVRKRLTGSDGTEQVGEIRVAISRKARHVVTEERPTPAFGRRLVGHRCPVDTEQCVGLGRGELFFGDRPDGERVDGDHRQSGVVGDGDRDCVPADRSDPDPDSAGTVRVYLNTVERERQSAVADVHTAQHNRMQRGIHQRGMHPEPVSVRGPQNDLGESLLTTSPRRPQPRERRAVGKPQLGETVVEPRHVHRSRVRDRPLRQPGQGFSRSGAGQRAGGMPDPRLVIIEPGEHRHRPQAALFWCTDRNLHPHGHALGQHQRRMQRQLVQPIASHLVSGVQRQFDHGRAW